MLAKLLLLAGAMQAALATTSTRHHYHHVHKHLHGHKHEINSTHAGNHGINSTYTGNHRINTTHTDTHKKDHHIEARDVGGEVVLSNRCYYDIWVWSVSDGYSSAGTKVPARTRYREPKRAPPTGGVVLKVSLSDQLLGGKHTQFEYAISNNQIYYDISFVDCAIGESAANCPGWDKGLNIDSPEPACGPIHCPPSAYCPHNAYFVDTPLQKLGIEEPVFGCGGAGVGMDLWMRTCADNEPMPL